LRAETVIGRPFDEVFRRHGGPDPWRESSLVERASLRVEGSIAGRREETLLGMTFSPLRDERERISGVICAFQDLTQIRRMEEQVRRSDRLAAIGELAAGMAHEIRNPLASLSGSVKLLSEELRLEGEGRELMGIVTREVGRLNALITDFLQYASPRPPQLRETSLRELLQETATLIGQTRGALWRIAVVAPGEDAFRAEVDAQMIRQLLWNLTLNAMEAMPGGGTVTVALAEEGEEVRIDVSDSGAGIAAGDLNKVFTPFYSTKEGGTGLGLAIVFKIVENHRGHIEVESTPGRGTTVRVALPWSAQAGAAARAEGWGTA
jgi:two-component system sensor histidine kinase PilS (NtrC family)